MTNLLRVHGKVTAIVGKALSPTGSLNNGPLGSGTENEPILPTLSNAHGISCEVIETLQSHLQRTGSRDSRELIRLLQRPAFQNLLSVHDTISQKDYTPRLPELPYDVDEEEETVKIVQLVKSNEPMVMFCFFFFFKKTLF